jgi:hypothetical protein
LREMLDLVPRQHPIFIFWQNLLGGTMGQSLYDVNAFCANGQPELLDWSYENFLSWGPQALITNWAECKIYEDFCE